MDTYQFITSLAWVLLGFITVFFVAYLILSGRLKWIQYNSIIGKIGLQVSSNLGLNDLSADEILAFESFVYRNLENTERGARLAYILLFAEKELLDAQYEDNTLKIDLTEKGKQLHLTILSECEKRLMISPQTEIKWRTGEKKIVSKKEENTTAKDKKILRKLEEKSKEEKILNELEENT